MLFNMHIRSTHTEYINNWRQVDDIKIPLDFSYDYYIKKKIKLILIWDSCKKK